MILRTAIPTICLALLATVVSERSYAQYVAPRFSIHVTNPLSLGNKFGGKLQYRLNQENSVLLSYRTYYGFFPGYQGAAEYHRYYRTHDRWESFFYGKVGIGDAGYTPKNYYSGWNEAFNEPGSYLFIGGGLGRRLNLGAFFISFNAGLKYCQTLEEVTNINENLFYTLGPASLLDCGVTLGIQFYNEERHMYRRTLGPHRPNW